MLHPDLASLMERALEHELRVEVFSNLVHVPEHMWPTLERAGVSLATSYYSDDSDEHSDITRRPSDARARANIEKVLSRRIPIRAGVIEVRPGSTPPQPSLSSPIWALARSRLIGCEAWAGAPAITNRTCHNCAGSAHPG